MSQSSSVAASAVFHHGTAEQVGFFQIRSPFRRTSGIPGAADDSGPVPTPPMAHSPSRAVSPTAGTRAAPYGEQRRSSAERPRGASPVRAQAAQTTLETLGASVQTLKEQMGFLQYELSTTPNLTHLAQMQATLQLHEL